MLEGIADIEAEAYRLLRTMGASPLTKVTFALKCTYGNRVLHPWSAWFARQLMHIGVQYGGC